MVPHGRPAETAAVIREQLGGLTMAADHRRAGGDRARAGRVDPGRAGVHLRRHRRRRRAFQPAHRRVDHADRLVGSAVAPGHQRVGPARAAPGHPATGAAARRGRAGQRRPGARCARCATSSERRQIGCRGSGGPAPRCGPSRGTPPPSTADAARARQAGTSTRATTSAATPAAGSTARRARRRPHPRPARRRRPRPPPTTRAASTGVMSVMPGAAVPAKSTVPYRSPCTSWLGLRVGLRSAASWLISSTERCPSRRARRDQRTRRQRVQRAVLPRGAVGGDEHVDVGPRHDRAAGSGTAGAPASPWPRAAAPRPRRPRRGAAPGVPVTKVSARQPATT